MPLDIHVSSTFFSEGKAVLMAQLFYPQSWTLKNADEVLTDVDQAVLAKVRGFANDLTNKSTLSVHKELKKRMNLDSIDGVLVEVLEDEESRGSYGYVDYCRIEYNNLSNAAASSSFPLQRMEDWVAYALGRK